MNSIQMQVSNWSDWERYTRVDDILTKFRPKTVLDVGCGMGIGTAEIGRKYQRSLVVGTDTNQNMVTVARCLTSVLDNVAIVRPDVVPEIEFDMIICFSVFCNNSGGKARPIDEDALAHNLIELDRLSGEFTDFLFWNYDFNPE